VFYTLGGSKPHAIDLPCCALQVLDDGTQQRVIVIQVEVGPDSIIAGVRPLDGGNGLCTIDELIMVGGGFDQ